MVTSSGARTPGNSLVMPFISSRTSLMSCSAAAARLRAAAVAVRWLLAVDLLLLQVAALDQHLVEILLGDDVRREQDGGNVLLVVVHHLAPGVDGLGLGDGARTRARPGL